MLLGIAASVVVAVLIGGLAFGHSTGREAAAGALFGVLGASVILAALRSCPFASDAESTEGVLGVVLAGGFAWIFGAGARAVISQRAADLGSGELRTGTFRLGWWWPWLLLSPTLIVLVLFLYLPAYRTFTLSTKLTRLGTPRVGERCLSNFSELLVASPTTVVMLPMISLAMIWGIGLANRRTTPGSKLSEAARTVRPFGIVIFLFSIYFIFENENGGYQRIYLNTVIVSSSIVIVSMAAGLALAYLTFQNIRGITVYRTLLIWP